MINGKSYIFSALDEFVEVSGDTMHFGLFRGGERVLEGTAEKFPDGRAIRFYLNRLADAYLDATGWENLLFSTGLHTNPEAGATFEILKDDIPYTLCSAYVIKGCGTATGMQNFPIDGKADPRMKIFVSNAGPAKTINLSVL